MPAEDNPFVLAPSHNEVVKFVYHGGGKDHTHETKTNVFLKSVSVLRKGEKHHYAIGPVEITMPRDTSIEFHSTAMDLMDTDTRLAIVKHVLQGVQGHPALRKMLQEAL